MKEIERIIRLNESEDTLSLPAQAACRGWRGPSPTRPACRRLSSRTSGFIPTFEEVFQAVSSGERLYGVIPIENTLAGSVTDNYDLMLRYHLFIVGSVTVKIEHSLLTLPGGKLEDLRQVYSHEQALHQCSDFFKANPQLTATPYSNTAASAKFVAEAGDPTLAAIGSEQCAKMYGLQVLQQGIQNRRDNFTRFVILARSRCWTPPAADQPGGAGAAQGGGAVRGTQPLCRAERSPAQAGIPTHPGQPV